MKKSKHVWIVAGNAGPMPLLYLMFPEGRVWTWDPNSAWQFPDEKSANVYRDREALSTTFEVSYA